MNDNKLRYTVKIASNGKEFVGIKINSSDCTVIFPIGFSLFYKLSEMTAAQAGENIFSEFQKDTRFLLRSLGESEKEREGIISVAYNSFEESPGFPLDSVLYLIKRFLKDKSYFQEREVLYTHGLTGKINWNRTIKQIKPVINDNSIAYLDFIIRKKHINENQIVTEIHKYCVFKAFEILGRFFSSVKPQKADIPSKVIEKNCKYVCSILKKKIEQTHLEDNKVLFINLYRFLTKVNAPETIDHFTLGTNSFNIVWEQMIDSIFENIQKKEEYFPHSQWTYANGTKGFKLPLEPDTITIYRNNCFILDSKYYDKKQMPENTSIVKQIAYGEYIYRNLKKKFSKYEGIYNVFILPELLNNKKTFEYWASNESDWSSDSSDNPRLRFNKIIALVFDTRKIMKEHDFSKERIKELCEFIISRFEEE